MRTAPATAALPDAAFDAKPRSDAASKGERRRACVTPAGADRLAARSA
ncbi:hypothetical protein [Frankia sp. AvcI1]|nr:hypothetical protein [Frankia sp. AvcI1]